MVKKHSKLITAVNEIERATSPFANLVITLVVTPPGADANKIKPTLSSTGIGNKKIKINAIMGKIITWEIAPIIKSFG